MGLGGFWAGFAGLGVRLGGLGAGSLWNRRRRAGGCAKRSRAWSVSSPLTGQGVAPLGSNKRPCWNRRRRAGGWRGAGEWSILLIEQRRNVWLLR
ncbi:MAG: hypothetical protein LBD24_06145 [Spirochaetaceae bacterium]|nr:hypothetical protein [Spirochaetaceae bacterium]